MGGVDRETLESLEGSYGHAVVVYIDEHGYPVSGAAGFRVDAGRGTVELRAVPGLEPPGDRETNVVFSHIRPQPQSGYDERRYVSLTGAARRVGDAVEFTPERSASWDEEETPFFQYSEQSVPQARRYLGALSAQRGREVRPRLSFGWLALRTLRAPFLTATLVPVLLGVAVAAAQGGWSLWLAFLTFIAGAFVHLGLNVANDVFDTLSGADAANTTPTRFSGGSRVVHYGLVRLRTLVLISAGSYLIGIGIGLSLAVDRGFWPLFWLGAAGVAISVFYTAPPFRLVHRGVGEVAVALGFGPIMLLGAYFVQAQRFSLEAVYASLPVAILIALVLYVNEIPDRQGDAAAGKRTVPVRLSKEAVITIYVAAVASTYLLIGAGAVSGILPGPTLLALATIPIAIRVVRGLWRDYDDPYALMFSSMGKNVQLHLFTGLLMLAGYLVAIAADRWMDPPSALLT